MVINTGAVIKLLSMRWRRENDSVVLIPLSINTLSDIKVFLHKCSNVKLVYVRVKSISFQSNFQQLFYFAQHGLLLVSSKFIWLSYIKPWNDPFYQPRRLTSKTHIEVFINVRIAIILILLMLNPTLKNIYVACKNVHLPNNSLRTASHRVAIFRCSVHKIKEQIQTEVVVRFITVTRGLCSRPGEKTRIASVLFKLSII